MKLHTIKVRFGEELQSCKTIWRGADYGELNQDSEHADQAVSNQNPTLPSMYRRSYEPYHVKRMWLASNQLLNSPPTFTAHQDHFLAQRHLPG